MQTSLVRQNPKAVRATKGRPIVGIRAKSIPLEIVGGLGSKWKTMHNVSIHLLNINPVASIEIITVPLATDA